VEQGDVALVVEEVAHLVAERYVFVDVALEIARAVRHQLATEGYARAGNAQELAALVTASLQSVNGDRHLRLLHSTEILFDDTAEDPLGEAIRLAAVHAGGASTVQRLTDGVAYLRLHPILFPPAANGIELAAAMTLVATAPALLIDLRDCLGGDPSAVAFICTYILGDEPVHLTDLEERHGDTLRTTQYWTLPYVPGKHYGPTKPIFLLTSGTTFSGAEDLCFVLKELGRATLVGETTGGGAHPREGFRVHPELEVTIPVARAVSPRTGTNWEGTGVTPDINVAAADAMTVALGRATDPHPQA
jgi:C-terminal processing protease CtpA/Prc